MDNSGLATENVQDWYLLFILSAPNSKNETLPPLRLTFFWISLLVALSVVVSASKAMSFAAASFFKRRLLSLAEFGWERLTLLLTSSQSFAKIYLPVKT